MTIIKRTGADAPRPAPVLTAQATLRQVTAAAQSDSSMRPLIQDAIGSITDFCTVMSKQEAVLSIANALDPYGVSRHLEVLRRAEALLEECLRDPAYTVDGAAPIAEAVQGITEEEIARWDT